MGAHALTRVLVVGGIAACAPASDAPIAVRATERIVGRALTADRAVLLTNAPTLVSIPLDSGRPVTTALARDRAASRLWGLGEIDGRLYSVAGFMDLVTLSPQGIVTTTARFGRPIGNLLDTPSGMAGQLAMDDEGGALAWAVDAAAQLRPLPGAVRHALGGSRAEDSVLHLLSCSLPPRVVCWLPGSNQLFAMSAGRLDAAIELESVPWMSPARLLSSPNARVIQDALRLEDGSVLCIFRPAASSDRTALALFAGDGRLLRTLEPRQPLRVLLFSRGKRVVAVAASGQLVEVAP